MTSLLGKNLVKLAKAAAAEEDFVTALEQWKKYSKRNPKDVEVYFKMGQSARRGLKEEEAQKYLAEYVRRGGDKTLANVERGFD